MNDTIASARSPKRSLRFNKRVVRNIRAEMTAIVLGMLLVSALSSFAIAERGLPQKKGYPLNVMTQNLYVGADIHRVLLPGDILQLAAETYQVLGQTDFSERAEALADEIARMQPELIGLQEVSWIRIQSPTDFVFYPPNAEGEVLNYLEILLAALETRGLSYEVAAIVQNADVELPMYAFDELGNITGVDDIRLTDHDVILARDDVDIANPISRNYAINAQFAVGGILVEFTRGFVAVDATVRDRSFRFVNTHLEEQGAVWPTGDEIQVLQVQELIDEFDLESVPVILVGDFNSSPEDDDTFAYHVIENAGYVDAWKRGLRGRRSRGATCCQQELLTNENSLLFERIDHIFARNHPRETLFSLVGAVRVVGDKQKDKTVSGLWPSDHAGVVAKMPLPSE
jgi:endonuclease/exonuclease/phosphatase family metal-dependent hydrolase